MKITNAFDIAVPLAVAWPVLNDVPRVARCFPKAVVDDDGRPDTYRIKIPLRIGFFTISYATEVAVVKRDDEAFTAELDIEGHQLGGGKVTAHVCIRARASDVGTHVDIETNAELGGLIATVGKPIVDGVAQRTVAEFAKRLETIIP